MTRDSLISALNAYADAAEAERDALRTRIAALEAEVERLSKPAPVVVTLPGPGDQLPFDLFPTPHEPIEPHRKPLVLEEPRTVRTVPGLEPVLQPGTRYVVPSGLYPVNTRFDVPDDVVIEAEDPANPPVIENAAKHSAGHRVFEVRGTRVRISNLMFATRTFVGTAIEVTTGSDVLIEGLRVRDPFVAADKFGETSPCYKEIVKLGNESRRVVVRRCDFPLLSQYGFYLRGVGVDLCENYVGDCAMEHPARCYASDVLIFHNRLHNKPKTTDQEGYRTAINCKERDDISIFENDLAGNVTLGPLTADDGNPNDPDQRLHRVRVFRNRVTQYWTQDLFAFAPGSKAIQVVGNVIHSAGGRLWAVDNKDGRKWPPGSYVAARGVAEAEIADNLVIGREGDVAEWTSDRNTEGLAFARNAARVN